MAKSNKARPRGAESVLADQSSRRPLRPEEPPAWILSPTDLTFLWDECPRCFYNKVVLKKSRPRTPFPKVFGLIDRAMKDFYRGERTDDLIEGAPKGLIRWQDRWVKSAPITVTRCSTPFVIRGRVDALVACDDETTGVIDFKTAEPNGAHLASYGRQLHAYALALEQPTSSPPKHVKSLGLLCFVPVEFKADGTGAALLGALRWIPVERDDEAFFGFLTEAGAVLGAGSPPPPGADCPWCVGQSVPA